jgi:hypothetical protein
MDIFEEVFKILNGLKEDNHSMIYFYHYQGKLEDLIFELKSERGQNVQRKEVPNY